MPIPSLPPHDDRARRERPPSDHRPAADPAFEPFSRRVDQFARQVAVMRRHAATLRRYTGGPIADLSLAPADAAAPLPADVVEDLVAALESLNVAEEELQQQHEQLAAAHLALECERQRYRSLFDEAPIPYLVTGLDGIIREANHAAAALLGVAPDELPRRPLAGYLAPDDRRAFRDRLAALPHDRGARAELSLTLLPRDGEPVDAEVTAQAASDPLDPGAFVLRWVLRDVTAERAAAHGVRRLNAELEARVATGTHELAARTAEIAAASEEKSRFLATLSHEIRTPVTAIVGYADLLDAGIGGPITETQHTYVDRLRASTGHLLSLVEGVLDLAKVEAGRVTLDVRSCPVHATVDDALAIVRPQADARGVRLGHACAGDECCVVDADEGRVRQILVNLLANAIRFTPPRGTVTVRCGVATPPHDAARTAGDGPRTGIAVADSGVGIPRAALAAVFEPFVHAGAGAERGVAGCGLGLTISRRLARLMRGDLVAESEPGRGSVFTLWLPAGSGASADSTR